MPVGAVIMGSGHGSLGPTVVLTRAPKWGGKGGQKGKDESTPDPERMT